MEPNWGLLTPEYRKLHQVIRESIVTTGIAPSVREMGAALHVPFTLIPGMLRVLERAGLVRRLPRRARGIVLIEADRAAVSQVAGRVELRVGRLAAAFTPDEWRALVADGAAVVRAIERGDWFGRDAG